MADSPLLECRNVSKAFGAVQALYRVDFEVRPGEVMALVGDNGAGKSTLIKGIVGIYPFDEGEVLRRRSSESSIHGPRDAARLGIEVVYQDLALADNLDVVANMFLGRERTQGSVVLDESGMERSARETLDGLSVTTLQSVRQAVAGLSGGQRQSVAVAKAVMWNSQRRDPRRADRRARRGPDASGAEPRAAPGGARSRRRDSSRTTSTTSSRSQTGSPCSGWASAWRVFERAKTTQQEVVHAITAGTLDHVPGMATRGGRAA